MLEEQRSQFQYFCETIEERASSFSSHRFTEETYFFFFFLHLFLQEAVQFLNLCLILPNIILIIIISK